MQRVLSQSDELPWSPEAERELLGAYVDVVIEHRSTGPTCSATSPPYWRPSVTTWIRLIARSRRFQLWLAGPDPTPADRLRAAAAVEIVGAAMAVELDVAVSDAEIRAACSTPPPRSSPAAAERPRRGATSYPASVGGGRYGRPREHVQFSAPLWQYPGEGSWYFVSVPADISDDIADLTAGTRKGFGSVRVTATIGSTTWQTSVFPSKSGTYLLPVKKAGPHHRTPHPRRPRRDPATAGRAVGASAGKANAAGVAGGVRGCLVVRVTW